VRDSSEVIWGIGRVLEKNFYRLPFTPPSLVSNPILQAVRSRQCARFGSGSSEGEGNARQQAAVGASLGPSGGACRMDLPGPTTSVGARTDYSVGLWDYPAGAARHLKAWNARNTQE
jgi:hypothetical protein